ncbi:MAG: tetratricopeptide repeat protein [Phycisphaerales bacterium]|nr:tetratricopeptide repeat protein [Phycisphaerales bacterium]
MDKLTNTLAVVGGSLLLVGVIALLAVADAQLFEEAEYSSLYDSTLREAYNRFKESDRQVPANARAGTDAGSQAMGLAAANPAAAAAQPNAARAQQMRQLQQMMAQQRGAAAGSAAQASHQHAQHDDGGVHMKKGSELLLKKQYDLAIVELQRALKENPNRPLAQHYIGDALRHQGKGEEAIKAYEAVLKISPTYYCCYTHIGDIYTQMKKPQKAEEAFAKCVEGYRKQIKDGGPQGSISKYHLAKFFMDHDRHKGEALVLAEQVTAETPDQPVYLHLLAQCYEAAGRKKDALNAIDKALQLNPNTPELYQYYRQRLMGEQPIVTPAGKTEASP